MEAQKSEVICTVYTVHNREAGLKPLKSLSTLNLFYGDWATFSYWWRD